MRWLVVLSALLSAPYHLNEGYAGPAASSNYLLASFGVIAAFVVHCVLERDLLAGARWNVTAKRVYAASMVCLMGSAGLEFLDYPLWIMGDGESGFFFTALSLVSHLAFFYVQYVEQFVVLAGSFLATLGFLLSIDVERAARGFDDGGHGVAEIGIAILVPFFCAATGFLTRACWCAVVYPHGMDGDPFWPMMVASICLILPAVVYGCLWSLSRLPQNASEVSRGPIFGASGAKANAESLLWIAFGIFTASALVRMGIRIDYLPPLPLVIVCVATTGITVGLGWLVWSYGLANVTTMECRIEDGASRMGEFLASQGLSPREVEFSLAVARGESSPEIAKRAGVKPVTVRTTLHRVYAKLLLSGEGDLRKLLDQHGMVEAGESGKGGVSDEVASADGDAEGRGVTVWTTEFGAVGWVCHYALVFLVFAPRGTNLGWGYGTPALAGIALALVAAALSYEIRNDMRGARRFRSEAGGGRTGRVARCLVRGAYAILLASAWAVCLIMSEGNWARLSLQGAAVDAMPVVAFAITTWWVVNMHFTRGGSQLLEVGVDAACGMVLSILVRAFDSVALASPVLISGTFILLFCPARRKSFPSCGAQKGACEGRTQSTELLKMALPALLAGVLCGSLYEETWRAVGGSSFVGAAYVALVSMALSLCWTYRDVVLRAPRARPAVVALGVFACILLCRIFLTVSMASLWCLLMVGACVSAECRDRGGGFTLVVGVTGMAMLGAWYLFNAVQDMGWAAEHSSLATSTGIAMVTASLLAVACCAVGPCLIAIVRFAREEQVRAAFAVQHAEPSTAKRQAALLTSRGLSEVQVSIMIETARGKSAREIAEAVHYAPSTVRALRSALYRQLGCRDRFGLIRMLSQVDAL